MELIKFYENNTIQCFHVKHNNIPFTGKFKDALFLIIGYTDNDVNTEYTNNISSIFSMNYDFVYVFSKIKISMDRFFKNKHIQNAVADQKVIITSRFTEYVKDNAIYFTPIASTSKVSFQVLDNQLLSIPVIKENLITNLLKKYNATNKDNPIKVTKIFSMLSKGYGKNANGDMIRFIDKYKDDEYTRITPSSVIFGCIFKSASTNDEINKLEEIERTVEDLSQKIILYETFNHPISELKKLKGAKVVGKQKDAIEISIKDLNASGLKWKITDFIC